MKTNELQAGQAVIFWIHSGILKADVFSNKDEVFSSLSLEDLPTDSGANRDENGAWLAEQIAPRGLGIRNVPFTSRFEIIKK